MADCRRRFKTRLTAADIFTAINSSFPAAIPTGNTANDIDFLVVDDEDPATYPVVIFWKQENQ